MNLTQKDLSSIINQIVTKFIKRAIWVLLAWIPCEIAVFILWRNDLFSNQTFYYASIGGMCCIATVLSYYFVSRAKKNIDNSG